MSKWITENFSYKVVSLLIALVLWLTILGRRDFALSKVLEVEMLVGAGRTLVSQSTEEVRIKAVGPRNSLRKFIDSGVSQVLTVDVSRLGAGSHEVEIPLDRVEVPFGVKVESVRPPKVKVVIR